jgi:WD40 repeat protein
MGQSGRIILTGSKDRTARLWDSQTGMALGQTVQHPSEVSNVALSPDERLALTISSDGSVHLWDVESCKPLARPMQYETSVNNEPLMVKDAMFSPVGSAILFQCTDGTARLYHVPPPLPDEPARIRAWARVRSGFELDENSVPRQLSQAEWLQARQELATLQDLP